MVGHNTYEIWGGLKFLKGMFLGKTYVHTMYSECTGSLIQVSPHHTYVDPVAIATRLVSISFVSIYN
jgi:hypothetical protein